MTPQAVIGPARLAGNCLLRSQSDDRLVDLVRGGNERAFEAIVHRYRGALLRHCRRMLSDGRAEDALQQTLLRAHAAMHADDRPLHLRPWLFRIATNASLDALRQPGWSHEQLDPNVDGVERPDQALERHEDLRAALAAVQQLPPRQRDVIVLRELEGRSYEEIADELGVSGGAVRQLLHRGRAGLRGAVTAVTPGFLITRLSFASPAEEPIATRIAELAAGPGSVGVAQSVATVLAVGTIAGGVAGTGSFTSGEGLDGLRDTLDRGAVSAAQDDSGSGVDPVDVAASEDDGSARQGEDRSGPNRGSDGEDRSGPSGGGEGEDRSGPGGDDDEPGELRSRRRTGKEPPDADEPDDADDGGGRRGRGRGGPTEQADAEPVPDGDTTTGRTDLSGGGTSGGGGSSGPGTGTPGSGELVDPVEIED